MIFLKKIISKGFKSFATETIVEFDGPMTSIIGPNGSGKSNIVDAIKWTIGEQSIKQLRGHNKENLIFAGADGYPAATEAYVELYFDNTNNFFNIETDEVIVKRYINIPKEESIYYINNKVCKLKEIHDMFLDTGLTKGSLGIISQGTVSQFSEAKPENRKMIFHEAAGIGKYTKRKNEAINQLNNAKEFLTEISFKRTELQSELNKYINIKEKADELAIKKEQLRNIELYVASSKYEPLKKEIDSYTQQDIVVRNEFQKIKDNTIELSQYINDYNNQLKQLDQIISNLRKEDQVLLQTYTDIQNKINAINMHLENSINSTNPVEQANAYKIKLSQLETTLNNNADNIKVINQQIDTKNNILINLKKDIDKCNIDINSINNVIYNLSNVIQKLNDQKNHSSDKCVSALLQYKEQFPGLINIVGNMIKIDDKYNTAISVALGGAYKSFVTLDETAAIKAVEFLRKNSYGVATFLPLNKIDSRILDPQRIATFKNQTGYIGMANELVKIDNKYIRVIEHLLGNIIIVDNIENAKKIANIVQQKLKIVTLDGDVKNPGGSITGGYRNIKNVLIDYDSEINKKNVELDDANNKKNALLLDIKNYNNQKDSINEQIYILKNDISNMQNSSNEIKNEISVIKAHLDVLNVNNNDSNYKFNENDVINLQNKIDNITHQRSVLSNEIFSKEEQRNKLNAEKLDWENKNVKYNETIQKYQNDIINFANKLSELKEEFKSMNANIINNYNIDLENNYQNYLTNPIPGASIEVLYQKISILKNEINRIGYIEEDYLSKLEEVKVKFETIDKEYNKSWDAVNTIQKSIDELDSKAINEYRDKITKINQFLPTIFQKFFGGGTCEIKLIDPDNVLESGIDIIVKPIGKNISNLTLLSGGEKTLISLTILFSILKVSNFPLIILDEAEAALDEGNVELFSNMIKEFAHHNQFIIITHRNGTMKNSNNLIGISMENRGVSKIFKTSYDKILTFKDN